MMIFAIISWMIKSFLQVVKGLSRNCT